MILRNSELNNSQLKHLAKQHPELESAILVGLPHVRQKGIIEFLEIAGSKMKRLFITVAHGPSNLAAGICKNCPELRQLFVPLMTLGMSDFKMLFTKLVHLEYVI